MLAYGKITLWAGDPDNGKSFATTDVAARYTAGTDWPDGTPIGAAGTALLFSAEDDLADTIRPRLEQAGGNPDRLFVADDLVDAQGKLAFFTLHDVEALRIAIEESGATLVIIDPTAAYLGDTDSNNNSEMRALLRPVAKLAAELGVIVIVISHLNKAGALKALYRVQNSIGLVGAVRLAYVFARGLEADHETIYLGKLKANISRGIAALAFRFSPTTSHEEIPRLVWDRAPTMTRTIEELLAGEAPKPPARPAKGPGPAEQSEASSIESFLEQTLAYGPVRTPSLMIAARQSGVAWRNIERWKARNNGRVAVGVVGRGTDAQAFFWYRPVDQKKMDALVGGGP